MVIFENTVAELYWRSLPEASNVEGKIGLVDDSMGDVGFLGV